MLSFSRVRHLHKRKQRSKPQTPTTYDDLVDPLFRWVAKCRASFTPDPIGSVIRVLLRLLIPSQISTLLDTIARGRGMGKGSSPTGGVAKSFISCNNYNVL